MEKKNTPFSNLIFNLTMASLKKMQEKKNLTPDETNTLQTLYSNLCKALKYSEHSNWKVEWAIEKWNSMSEKLAGIAPYEVVTDSQNIILDTGANEMLKLIIGTGTAFNNANTKIYVGTDSTSESASQTGVLAQGANRAFANMDSGYPIVNGRTITFRASFGDDVANFAWREVVVQNGSGANAVALNRKTSDMGTKSGGVWTAQVTITVVSAS